MNTGDCSDICKNTNNVIFPKDETLKFINNLFVQVLPVENNSINDKSDSIVGYSAEFPEYWINNHLPETGPECSKCLSTGTINGIFYNYCYDCASIKYKGKRGFGAICKGKCVDTSMVFMKEGIVYSPYFPREWARCHPYGTGPINCNLCKEIGFDSDNMFEGYCPDCIINKFYYERPLLPNVKKRYNLWTEMFECDVKDSTPTE
jgi:hypothetical protein